MNGDRYDVQYNSYRKVEVNSSYRRTLGLLTIPVMGPAGTAPVVARVHAPYGTRVSNFDLVKAGAPPVFPKQADTESGDILLGATVSVPAPVLDGEGEAVYQMVGQHVYVQPLGGRKEDSTIKFDGLPFFSIVDMMIEPDPEKGYTDLVAYVETAEEATDRLRVRGNVLTNESSEPRIDRDVLKALTARWVGNVIEPAVLSSTAIFK
jgi:hypothetical protein